MLEMSIATITDYNVMCFVYYNTFGNGRKIAPPVPSHTHSRMHQSIGTSSILSSIRYILLKTCTWKRFVKTGIYPVHVAML